MKSEKILLLSEFVKKFKKKHPELKGKQATKKARTEYKKYEKDKKAMKKDFAEIEKLRKEAEED